MQLRYVILGGAALIGAAWIIFGPHLSESGHSSRKGSHPDTSNPASHQRESQATKSRYSDLTPNLRRLVYDLEKKQRDWQDARDPHEGLHRAWNDWDVFSREQIAKLSTEDIAALATWYYEREDQDDSEFDNYRQALFYNWAARDYPSARKLILDIAKNDRLLEENI